MAFLNSRITMNKIPPVITIDGPSGSGKGTLSKKLAKILGWNLLDSGIIYRILTLEALEKKIDINNEKKLSILAATIKISFVNKINQFFIFVNGKEIKKNIYTEFIGNIASKIALFPRVREVLCRYQRTFCILPGLIADGRDMGTIVFPDAILKIFLYASFRERKHRQLNQFRRKNFNDNFECLLFKIKERDARDYNRKLAPLIPATDALVLDSTNLSEKEVCSKVLMHMKESLVLPIKIVYNITHDQG